MISILEALPIVCNTGGMLRASLWFALSLLWLSTGCAPASAADEENDPDEEGTGGTSATGSGGMASGSGGDGPIVATGGSDSPNSGGAPSSSGGGASDCSSLPVCDDFEEATLGADWIKLLNYSGNGPDENVALSTEDAQSGERSVKVNGMSTEPWAIAYENPGDTFYLRAWMKATSVTTSPVLIGIGVKNDHNNEIRMRFKTGKVTLNSAGGGDGLNPDPATCTECVDIPTDWFCAEMYYDRVGQNATLWIDGVQAAAVTSNAGWHSGGSFPATTDYVWFGTLTPDGVSPTVYIDDVAIGPTPIGCL